MKKAGEILREKREALGLGLQEVASILKINQKTLTAIEKSETENVLNKAFVKGFIRSYATYLKLDPKELLLLYQHETGEGTKLIYSEESEAAAETLVTPVVDEVLPAPIPLEAKPKIEKQVPFQEQDHSQSYLLIGLLGLVVVLSVAFAIKATMKRYKNETIVIPQPNIIQNSDQINMPNPAQPLTPEEMQALNTPPPDATALMTTVSADAVTSPLEKVTEAAKLQRPIEEAAEKPPQSEEPIVKKEEAKPIQATVEVTKPAAVPQTAVATEEKPVSNHATKEIIVESSGSVSVAYLMDGKTQTIQLKKDQVHIFKGKGPIKLDISDGQLVNVNVNGRDIGKPSTQAGPVSVTY